MSDLTLFDIQNWITALVELRDNAESDEERAAADTELASVISTELSQKGDDIATYLHYCDAMFEAARAEAERFNLRARAFSDRAERLEEAALAAMRAVGVTRIEGKLSTLRAVQNGGARPVVITEETLIPSEYVKMTWNTAIDKKALAKALAEGPVAGAHLGDRGTRLKVE